MLFPIAMCASHAESFTSMLWPSRNIHARVSCYYSWLPFSSNSVWFYSLVWSATMITTIPQVNPSAASIQYLHLAKESVSNLSLPVWVKQSNFILIHQLWCDPFKSTLTAVQNKAEDQLAAQTLIIQHHSASDGDALMLGHGGEDEPSCFMCSVCNKMFAEWKEVRSFICFVYFKLIYICTWNLLRTKCVSIIYCKLLITQARWKFEVEQQLAQCTHKYQNAILQRLCWKLISRLKHTCFNI